MAPDVDAPQLDAVLLEKLMQPAFERGSGHGLLLLGADETGTALPPVYAYWRDFGARYVTAICTQQDSDGGARHAPIPPPPEDDLERISFAAPPMLGAEYLTAAVLKALWLELDEAFAAELAESKSGVQDFLKRRNPAWNLVGRVHFNVAENRKDPRCAIRISCHVYRTALSASQSTASAARPGFARICRRGK